MVSILLAGVGSGIGFLLGQTVTKWFAERGKKTLFDRKNKSALQNAIEENYPQVWHKYTLFVFERDEVNAACTAQDIAHAYVLIAIRSDPENVDLSKAERIGNQIHRALAKHILSVTRPHNVHADERSIVEAFRHVNDPSAQSVLKEWPKYSEALRNSGNEMHKTIALLYASSWDEKIK